MPDAVPSRPVDLGNNTDNSTHVQKAIVLYDYDAKDATELSLMADEVTINFL